MIYIAGRYKNAIEKLEAAKIRRKIAAKKERERQRQKKQDEKRSKMMTNTAMVINNRDGHVNGSYMVLLVL